MRKKVDDRIRTLIDNGVRLRHRSMFVIVGDKSRDQIVHLNYMLTRSVVKARPSVLWCYKDKLEISSHRKKRAKQVKKMKQRGTLDPEKADQFSLFVESGNITYCLYKDSERVLGNTFGMCILQDFEAVTPNLLARTIETVEGGGLVILLLRSLPSLTSLYTMTMDVHERFRTESHSQAAARFNERFMLSIALCKACVVMDDELNVLPISSHIRSIQPVSITEDPEGLSEKERELKNMKEEFHDDFPVGPLIGRCCTMDQGKAVVTFLDAILDKTLRSTVALIAARGRGKSAALGLAVAGAIAAGYSNIFVTAPSPENLKTLFEFVCKGFNALDYKILDLLPIIAHLYFQEKIPVTLAAVEAAVLFCIGLQNKDFSFIKKELVLEPGKELGREQILSAFSKVVKKLYNSLYSFAANEIDSTIPRLKEVTWTPHSVSVDEDLDQAAKEVMVTKSCLT